MVAEATAAAEKARENPDMLPIIEGPQDYVDSRRGTSGECEFRPR